MDALTTSILQLPDGFREAFASGELGIPLTIDRVSLFVGFTTATYDVDRDIEIKARDGLWRIQIPDWETETFCARNGTVILRVAHDGHVDGVQRFTGAKWATIGGVLVISAEERTTERSA